MSLDLDNPSFHAAGVYVCNHTYMTQSDKTNLIARNTPMCIMVSISCSVDAIQIL